MPRVPSGNISDGGLVVLVCVVVVLICVVIIRWQRGFILGPVAGSVGGVVEDRAEDIPTPLIRARIII